MENVTFYGAMRGIEVKVKLSRDRRAIIMIIYFPTILMNIINIFSNYIRRRFHFDVVIGVNITSMMVLASLYIYFSSVLPPSPQIKTVEIWLIFSLIFPFLVITLNTFLHILKLDRNISNGIENMKSTENEHGRSGGWIKGGINLNCKALKYSLWKFLVHSAPRVRILSVS